MSKVLIFGNVVKDVYLKLDERKDEFEKDDEGVAWLNLGFDGQHHSFFQRTSVFGGATVTLEVLKKFGVEAKIAGVDENGIVATEYRYILSRNDGIAYFVPEKRAKTRFEEPDEDTNMILIDRSAEFSENLTRKVLETLEKNPKILLVVYAPKVISESAKSLLERANLIFSDDENLTKVIKNRRICLFDAEGIKFGKLRQGWNVERADLMTHLTVYSIAMASILGGILRRKGIEMALLMTKANVENSSLNGTLGVEKLEELVENETREKVNLELIAKTLAMAPRGVFALNEKVDLEKKIKTVKKRANGVVLTEKIAKKKVKNGQNYVDFLTTNGVIAGILLEEQVLALKKEEFLKKLENYYKVGFRFAKWQFEDDSEAESCRELIEKVVWCQEKGLMPLVTAKTRALEKLTESLQAGGVNMKELIISRKKQ